MSKVRVMIKCAATVGLEAASWEPKQNTLKMQETEAKPRGKSVALQQDRRRGRQVRYQSANTRQRSLIVCSKREKMN